MPSHDPQLRQIRASAGSGKTYELTTSFLKHLSGAAEAGGGPFSGCSAVHSGPHGWPEILAVTFTNRAAAEMQERIIGRLKDTALGTDKPAPGWTREQARRWVGIILRRYGALNVRTIDSLLHLIVRLTALELDLPPDFEPVFATDEAIACWNSRGVTNGFTPCWRKHVGTFFSIPRSAVFSPEKHCANGSWNCFFRSWGRNPSHSRIPLKLRNAWEP